MDYQTAIAVVVVIGVLISFAVVWSKGETARQRNRDQLRIIKAMERNREEQ